MGRARELRRGLFHRRRSRRGRGGPQGDANGGHDPGEEGLSGSGVELDVLVASAGDRGERYVSGTIEPLPRAVVLTAGAEGGLIEDADGTTVRWAAPPLPGPVADTYGAGDSFAGG